MANKITIDITTRLVDEASKSADKLSSSLAKLQARIDKLDKASAEPKIGADTSGFEDKYEDAKKKSEKLGKSKFSAKIDAIDNASKKVASVTAKAERLAGRMFRFALGVIDGASKTVGTVSGVVKGLVGRAWNITIGLVDKVTAPVRKLISSLNSVLGLAGAGISTYGLIIKPIQLQVEYENLTTTFDVLLGSADAAQKRIDELTTFAGQTPFTRDEIYKANRILQVYTGDALGAVDAKGGVKMVGDIAAATQSDYTNVATWIGRLYSDVTGGGSVGEATAALQDMGAMSAEARQRIADLSEQVAKGGISGAEAWEKVTKEFERFDGIMEKQSDKLGNLLLGVKSFVNNNFIKKIGAGLSEGISPFLQKFREWRSENGDVISGWATSIQDFAKSVSTKATDALEKFATKAYGVFSSSEFQNADFFGKVSIAWNKIIAEPFSEWWNDSGKSLFREKAKGIGESLGTGLSKGLMALLGIDVTNALDDGASIGAAFIKGFKSKFDVVNVADALRGFVERAPDLIKNVIGKLGNIWDGAKEAFRVGKAVWDYAIATPFSEWWNSGGKGVIVGSAGKLGKWLGEGITNGVTWISKAIQAIFTGEGEGIFGEIGDVGHKFWTEFVDSFDAGAITSAIVDAINAVWNALPAWAQTLLSGYGTVKGFGALSRIIGAGKTVIGAVGSASQGTGILGYGANAAINMGAGNLAGGASLSAGALSGLGLGATAGGVVGGVTIISGANDIYRATQTAGKESRYNAAKGAVKIGGAGVGALTGAAIGSVIPGVGTVVGGLIGAGIGGIAGMWSSDSIAKATTGYDELKDSAEAAAENTLKLERATEGYSEASKEAIRNSKANADAMEALKKTKLDEWYGDVSLSAEEAADVASRSFNKMIGKDAVKSLENYRKAVDDIYESAAAMSEARATTDKLMWKVQMGLELTEDEETNYVSAVQSYVDNAQTWLDSQHYAVTASIELIMGKTEKGANNPILESTNAYYEELQKQLDEQKLTIKTQLELATDGDDSTNPDQNIIQEAMNKIQEIQDKISAAMEEAKWEALTIKYDGVDLALNPEAAAQLQQEIGQFKEDYFADLDEGLQLDIANLKLQLQDGAIDESTYNDMLLDLQKKYNQRKIDFNAKVEKFVMDTSGAEITGIEEDGSEIRNKVEELIGGALEEPVSPAGDLSMILPEMARFVDADGNPIDAEMFQQNMENALLQIVDQNGLSNALSDIIDEASATISLGEEQKAALEAAGLEIPQALLDGIQNAQDTVDIAGGIMNYLNGEADSLDMGEAGAIIWNKIATIAENTEGAENVAIAMKNAGMTSIKNGLNEISSGDFADPASGVRTDVESAITDALSTGIDADVDVTVTPNVSVNSVTVPVKGTDQSITVGGNARGGFIDGMMLSWLGEEGPEAVIPLVGSRRARGIDLWMETGRRLGVLENANGGIVGSNTYTPPESGSFDNSIAASSGNVSIEIGGVTVEIKATEGKSIVESIKEQGEEIAEAVAGVITEKLVPIFQNTPSRA